MSAWRLPPWTCRKHVSASDFGEKVPWGLVFDGIDKLHAQTKGAGVKVAVLDQGCDINHPDLFDQIIEARDFSRSSWGADDRAGHGTHTAGTIASIDNEIGVIGVAPESKLLIGKVLGDDGNGDMETIASGIMWSVDNGADVISMSLGGSDPDDSVKHALEYAHNHGVLVCCAAGNAGHIVDRRTGQDVNTVDYPGRWTSLCSCVGAHDEQGQISEFSSRGPEVDFLAPGVNVPSCWPGGRYAFLDGTSMATPFVAGTIALVIAYRRQVGLPPIKSQAGIETELFRSAIKVGNGSGPFGAGHGLLNPKGTFEDMIAAPIAPDPLGPKVIRVQMGAFLGHSWELIGTPKAA